MEFGRRGVRGLTAVPGVSRALRDAHGLVTILLLSMEAHLASVNHHSGFRAPCYVQVGLLLFTLFTHISSLTVSPTNSRFLRTCIYVKHAKHKLQL